MNPCAWCLAEHGQAPQPGDSHGICRRHRNEMLGVPQVRVWFWSNTSWPVNATYRRSVAGAVLFWAVCLVGSVLAGLLAGQLAALTGDWLINH